MKVIFYFDDTIFDTKKFKEEALFNAFIQYGFTNEFVKNKYQEHRKENGVFELIDFINFVFDKSDKVFNSENIQYEIVKKINTYIKEEYRNLVTRLGRENVFIVSQGDEQFQRLKIKNADMEILAEEIIIVNGKKEEEIRNLCLRWDGEQVLFLDDKFTNLILENIPSNLQQYFVGDENSLNKEQKSVLKKLNIKVLKDLSDIREF